MKMLFGFYLIYFVMAFVFPTWRLWRRTGVNGLVLKFDDSAAGYVARWFRVVMIGVFGLLGAIMAGLPLTWLGPLPWLTGSVTSAIGWTLMVGSALLIAVAQAQMGSSWRIGMDDREQPPLVTTGFFARTRNPIFLGMRLNLLGLFLVLPNAFTLAILLLAEVLIQVQVRLEEEHLGKALGPAYAHFRGRVPRWL